MHFADVPAGIPEEAEAAFWPGSMPTAAAAADRAEARSSMLRSSAAIKPCSSLRFC